MSGSALAGVLGSALCPWLREPLARLEDGIGSGRFGHAWLIRGPSGVGKLNLAHVLARRLLTGEAGEPAPLGPDTAAAAMRERRAPADHHPDLHPLCPPPDKRSIGIEQVRELSEALAMKGYRGAAKVALIEPAEAMTPSAANALLKTLEEPAPETYLLLVTHQPDRLLPTLRSRCQSLAVAAPPPQAVAEWLGLDAADHPVMRVAGRAPLRAAELIAGEKLQLLEEFEEKLYEVSRSQLDPRTVAEDWYRKDIELALDFLARRLEGAIRQRAAPRDSKAVTPAGADKLHNAWRTLPTRALFERLAAAERLLDRLGSGINTELALHELLMGFRAKRGQT